MRAAGIAAALALAGATAHAQNAAFDPRAGRGDLFNRDDSLAVATRRQPGFDPVPLQVGSFNLLASLTGSAAYDDNVFATRTDKGGIL